MNNTTTKLLVLLTVTITATASNRHNHPTSNYRFASGEPEILMHTLIYVSGETRLVQFIKRLNDDALIAKIVIGLLTYFTFWISLTVFRWLYGHFGPKTLRHLYLVPK